jgi:hypothetical protein
MCKLIRVLFVKKFSRKNLVDPSGILLFDEPEDVANSSLPQQNQSQTLDELPFDSAIVDNLFVDEEKPKVGIRLKSSQNICRNLLNAFF